MQKGMPYPWLMRFHLSAAIALPSVTLLWMTAPAGAFDGSYVPETSDSTSLSSQAAQRGDRALSEALSVTSTPEIEKTTTQNSLDTDSTAPKSAHRHQSGYSLTSPPDSRPDLSSPHPQAWRQSRPSLDASETVAPTQNRAVVPEAATSVENTETTTASTALPTVEAPAFEVMFSQELPAPPPQDISDTSPSDAANSNAVESLNENATETVADTSAEAGDSIEDSFSTNIAATDDVSAVPPSANPSEDLPSEETLGAIEIEVISAPSDGVDEAENADAIDIVANDTPNNETVEGIAVEGEATEGEAAENETEESDSNSLDAPQTNSDVSDENIGDLTDADITEIDVAEIEEDEVIDNSAEALGSDAPEADSPDAIAENSDSANVAQTSGESEESSDGEEVFSPLPESDEDSETESEAPEAEVDLDEFNQPSGAGAVHSSGESVPIPEERVLDELPYLDPDPNPLLIQTQPEEVEIIGLQPITLEEAVELSYRNNPDIQIALLELEQSQAALREAQADNLPTVSLNGVLQGQSSDTFFNEGELAYSASAEVDVIYNLYSSGLRAASIRAAEEQVELSELEVERRREELRLVTANEYYDLQTAIESIRINQAFLEEAERNLADTALREEVGIGTRFDVLRAEVQVANARQDLVNSEASRQVAQRALAARLNVPPSLTITTSPVDIAGTWSLDLEESIVLAYQNRAELEQQLVQRDISEELRQAELAALGPQVDLFAEYTLTRALNDTFNQVSGFNDSYRLGAQVSWTLFDGGAARARAEQRELDSEIAERTFEDSRNTVRLSVESAFYNLEANLENISTAQLAVEQAEEARDLAILRFDAGVGTQLDILTAQSELTDAEVNLVQAIVGYNRSLAELERAVSNIPEPFYDELPF